MTNWYYWHVIQVNHIELKPIQQEVTFLDYSDRRRGKYFCISCNLRLKDQKREASLNRRFELNSVAIYSEEELKSFFALS